MGQKRNPAHGSAAHAGKHLSLSIAAHLARSRLVPDPRNVYDPQHLLETLDIVGNALVRVAPVHMRDSRTGERRELAPNDLDGATVKRGATVLVLADGRVLSALSIRREDLQQAIGILSVTGVPGLLPRVAEEAPPPPEPDDRVERLQSQLAELERLLTAPLIPAQVARANNIAISIARAAPNGIIANLAMRLMSAVHEARTGAESNNVRAALARLRAALEGIASE